MTTEKKQMFTRKITQANRTQLVVIVYEMLLTYLEDADSAHKAGDRDEYVRNIDLARGCIAEMRAGLNFQYDLAKNLFSIYCYADRALAKARYRYRAQQLEEIQGIFTKLRDAYDSISTSDDSEPLMDNIQSVYAGLTYGRTDVNETVTNYDAARGYRV